MGCQAKKLKQVDCQGLWEGANLQLAQRLADTQRRHICLKVPRLKHNCEAHKQGTPWLVAANEKDAKSFVYFVA